MNFFLVTILLIGSTSVFSAATCKNSLSESSCMASSQAGGCVWNKTSKKCSESGKIHTPVGAVKDKAKQRGN